MRLTATFLAVLAVLLLAENGLAQVLFRGNDVPFQKPRPRRTVLPRLVAYARPKPGYGIQQTPLTSASPGHTTRPETSGSPGDKTAPETNKVWVGGRSSLPVAVTSAQPAITNRPASNRLMAAPAFRSVLPKVQVQPRFFFGGGYPWYDDYYYDYPFEYYEEYYYDYPYYW